MYTTLAFLTKVPHLTTQEFIDHYENKHVPLINRLAGPENQPLVYKRRYTHRDDAAHVVLKARVDAEGRPVDDEDKGGSSGGGKEGEESKEDKGNIDFDVITEIAFADKAGKDAWMRAVGSGENGKLVVEDEARFIWRARTRAFVVEDRVSFG